MNGPERLFETESGPLAEALRQARGRVADDAKLAKIAGGLASQGVPVDPGAIPASPGAAPGVWSLGGKIAVGVGGVLGLVALTMALRGRDAVQPAQLTTPSALASSSTLAPAARVSASGRNSAAGPPLVQPPARPGSGGEAASPSPDIALEASSEAPQAPGAGLGAPSSAAYGTPAEQVANAPSVKDPSQPQPRSTISPPSQAPARTGGLSGPVETEQEISVLKEARAVLSSNPRQALALTERHRSEYPRGSLVQERELIAITALVRLGQTSAARERADRFRNAYPRSAYLKQIDRVLGAP